MPNRVRSPRALGSLGAGLSNERGMELPAPNESQCRSHTATVRPSDVSAEVQVRARGNSQVYKQPDATTAENTASFAKNSARASYQEHFKTYAQASSTAAAAPAVPKATTPAVATKTAAPPAAPAKAAQAAKSSSWWTPPRIAAVSIGSFVFVLLIGFLVRRKRDAQNDFSQV